MSQSSPNAAVIAEIESAFRSNSDQKRLATLMRVTDLFVGAADRYSDEEVKLFGDVMGHLIQHVESRALVELSRRIGPIANAPSDLVGTLARHDEIEIAGPVLEASERLSDADLVEIAGVKSQAHLAKIAVRPRISETVTEVLVDRGDDEVANTVAGNAGARFSDTGFTKLVIRAEGNDRLTETVMRRADIPPRLFRQLTIHATEAVRARLLASAQPDQQDTIKRIMDELAAQIGSRAAAAKERNYVEAQHAIAAIRQDTSLMKSKILEFADGNRLAEAIVALAELSGVSIKEIDTLVRSANEIGLTVLCKAVALEVDTAHAVVMAARIEGSGGAPMIDDFCQYYDQLTVASAQKLLRFWQGRQKVARRFPGAA